MKKSVVLFLAILATMIARSLQAQTTAKVYWDFTSASPTSGLFSGLAVSALSQGNNHGNTTLLSTTSPSSGYTTAAGFAASGANNAGAAVVTNTPFSTATSTYLAFDITLSLAAGASYGLSDISLGSRQTPTGPQLLSLYESTDGFATVFNFLGSASVANNNTWAAVDFSDLALTLPDDGSTYSFRIYASSGVGNATAGNVNWRIDDLAVTMTSVSVPEPATLTLATLGGVACLLMMHRKR